jgi:hypothetical protein
MTICFPGAALRRESRQEHGSLTPTSIAKDDKNNNSGNNNNSSSNNSGLVVAVQLENSSSEQMTEVERSLRSRMAKRDGLMK